MKHVVENRPAWWPFVPQQYTAECADPVPAAPGEGFVEWQARQPLPIDSEGGHPD